MNILLACQKSGYLRTLLREMGHNAFTCDLLPSEDASALHIRRDAVEEAYSGFYDAMIAMPECINLCSSGQHWNGKPGHRTQADVDAAADFFVKLVNAPIPLIAIENSIGIMSTRYRKPDQIIHPHWFGDDASKATCLWLKGFPPLIATEHIAPRIVNGKPRWANQTDSGQNRLGPSPTRSADRARTYPGIARAFASQWFQSIQTLDF